MDKRRKEAESLPDSARMMDFFRQELEKRRSQSGQPDAYETYEALMLQIVEMWGAFTGNECETQGLKNLWLDAGLEGGGVAVTAADGFRGVFDDIVVAAPLGWLKRNEDVFSPPLAPRISTAIRSLGYGNLDRVFIRFPEAFWNSRVPKTSSYQVCTAEKNWSPAFPIESLFLHPEYAADTNPAKWRQEIISFSGLPEPFSQPVIMFFIYGQWARHITGLVRGMAQDSQEYYQTLDDNFRPYYSKIHYYDSATPKCKPLTFMSTDW
ncbi:MAG: hypothetical protein LQ348_005282 [Seirophora lacunosa]|nr:MAG: hypothetical protein LQ348_005282 [Seirophora lacunosa]